MIRIIIFTFLLFTQYGFAEDSSCNSSIKKTVLKKYQSLLTYSDKSELITDDGLLHKFETTFVTPDKFSFIFYHASKYANFDVMTFTYDGETALSVFKGESDSEKWVEKSVNSMIDGGAGVTNRSIGIVPPLLLGLGSIWTSKLMPNEITSELNDEGVLVCKVLFKIPGGSNTTFWIQNNGIIERVFIQSNYLSHHAINIEYYDTQGVGQLDNQSKTRELRLD